MLDELLKVYCLIVFWVEYGKEVCSIKVDGYGLCGVLF